MRTVHTPALAYPVMPSSLPRRLLNHPPYTVTFARSAAELGAVLRLRFEVFNLELREGFAESHRTGRDEDMFDAVMHHLMVLKMPERDGRDREGPTREHPSREDPNRDDSARDVVGTYRLQTAAMAREHLGFYTGTEFDLSALPPGLTDQAIEIGRACIARASRNRLVLFLLWKGLAAYMLHNQQRYLFGCCSLTSQDPAEGWRAYRHLEAAGHVHPEFRVTPREEYRCGEPAALTGIEEVRLPLLFRTYLRYGAKVCGPPVIDREFGTIDFFVLMDVQHLAPNVFDEYFQ